MKTIADTNGFRIQCECGEQTQTHTQIGAAREAHQEHNELEHLKARVTINLYRYHLSVTCACGYETRMHKDITEAEKEYMQHLKEEH